MDNQRKTAEKRSFWDILRESSKGLGILFPSDNKNTPRSVRTKINPPEIALQEEKRQPAKTSFEEGGEEKVSDLKKAAEAIQEMRETLGQDLGLPQEGKELQVLDGQDPEVLLSEETKKYFHEFRQRLEEIHELQAKQNQENSMTPAIVENALEKFFYWVQERENKQVEENIKEAEQRLNSGQLEILMELRTLVDQTNQASLAEEKILYLTEQVSKGKKRVRILIGFLIVFILGVAGFGFWLWVQGSLVLRAF